MEATPAAVAHYHSSIGRTFMDYIKMTRADIVVAVARSEHKGTPEVFEILAANLGN